MATSVAPPWERRHPCRPDFLVSAPNVETPRRDPVGRLLEGQGRSTREILDRRENVPRKDRLNGKIVSATETPPRETPHGTSLHWGRRRDEKVAPLVRQLPWTHHLIILGQAKRPEERELYLRLAIRE